MDSNDKQKASALIKTLTQSDQIDQLTFQQISLLNEENKSFLLANISDEIKEKILKFFSKQSLNSNNAVRIPESNKPLWVNSVKQITKEIIPSIDLKELEFAKNELVKQSESELDFLQNENNPFINTIRRLMYAFGDLLKYEPNSVIYLNNFLRKWYWNILNRFASLMKILLECEFKKTIEHLFSHEYAKFYTYRRLKFKNNFTVKNTQIEDKDETESVKEGEELSDEQMIYDDPEEEEKDPVNHIFEVKDENYNEYLAFQDHRTQIMTHTEYMEFQSCRQVGFLSRGRKLFYSYLADISKLPLELKDHNNLDLIAFLAKELIKRIVEKVVRSRSEDKKLRALKYPILEEDLEIFCQTELENLDQFYKDYNSCIYLIKEFKKKKFCKQKNKYIKIKRERNSLYIIVKKLAFLEETEAEELGKIKTSSERAILSFIKKKRRSKPSEYKASNFYEHWLLKSMSEEEKVDKRKLKKLFEEWMGLSSKEKREIIEEYNNNL